MRTVETIQADIDSTERAIQQGGVEQSQIDLWNAQLAEFTKELQAAQQLQQDQETRVQAQAVAVESITLPYDFNDLFSDGDYKVTTANDMIIEVIKDFRRESDALHNAEITQLINTHKDELRAASDRESQLQRQNDTLQETINVSIAEINKLTLEKTDAESKRDAAAQEIVQLNSHIDDLREQLANAPAIKPAIDITPTDKLAQMVKESNEAKVNRGLQRWNTMLPEVVTPPVLPSLDSNNAEVTALPPAVVEGNDFRPQDVPSAINGLDQHGSTAQVVGQTVEERLAAVEARVMALETQKAAA